MKLEQVEAGGHRIEVLRIAGDQCLPTLVLLHEGLGCAAMWKDFPQRLAALRGHPVLAYSRTGYGGSDPVELPRPIEFHRQEARLGLPALLDAELAGDYVLVGHSDGASIALAYAGERDDPRLAGVAVMAPHTRCEPKCVDNIERAVAAWREGGLRERLVRYHGDNVDCAFHGWSQTWLHPDFRQWQIEDLLAGISVPVLALRGEEDPYNTPIHLQRIADLVSGPCEVAHLAGVGHAPHTEAPDTVLAHLDAWLATLAGD